MGKKHASQYANFGWLLASLSQVVMDEANHKVLSSI